MTLFRPAALVALLMLSACDGVGTAVPEARIESIGDTPWRLARIGETEADSAVVLRIGGGFLSGTGPCNTLNANYVGEAPAFEIETLISTKMACDRLGFENRVIEALMNATRAEVANGRLTISGPSSATLVFVPD